MIETIDFKMCCYNCRKSCGRGYNLCPMGLGCDYFFKQQNRYKVLYENALKEIDELKKQILENKKLSS
jgi:hypothetical protein